MWPIFGGFNLEENTATLLISVDVHFPKMDVKIAHPPPAVRIKALRANHIPRFQTHSVRVSAGRQKATPLDVSAGRPNRAKLPFTESNAESGDWSGILIYKDRKSGQ